MSMRTRLILECTILFLALPLVIAWAKPLGYVYLILLVITLYCGHILQSQHQWSFKKDWNRAALTPSVIRRISIRFVPFALTLLAFTLFTIPDSLLSLPLHRPILWIAILLLYPPLSVLPQEIIGRSFFLRRYATIFSPKALIIASAAAFGWMHIIMQNWEAVVFSAIGGLLFADTYTRTKSLAAVCFEHALYGCYIFTIGLGYYFYHGNAMH